MGVIKISHNGTGPDVCPPLGNHLQALNLADAFVGIENKDPYPGNIGKALQSGLSRVPGSGDQNKDFILLGLGSECAGEQTGHELESHVFESQRRPVPEFENRRAVVEEGDGSGSGRIKVLRIRTPAGLQEFGLRVIGKEGLQDLRRSCGVGIPVSS